MKHIYQEVVLNYKGHEILFTKDAKKPFSVFVELNILGKTEFGFLTEDEAKRFIDGLNK